MHRSYKQKFVLFYRVFGITCLSGWRDKQKSLFYGVLLFRYNRSMRPLTICNLDHEFVQAVCWNVSSCVNVPVVQCTLIQFVHVCVCLTVCKLSD